MNESSPPHQPGPSSPVGLYDPAFEKDSCGIGFIAHLGGTASHSVVDRALTMLENMAHRGATGCEPNTGDGAGLLTAVPDAFMRAEAKRLWGRDLPPAGRYAVGAVFIPPEAHASEACLSHLRAALAHEHLEWLGVRDVPVDDSEIGPTAKAGQPWIRQVLVAAPADLDGDAFEDRLYLARARATRAIRDDAAIGRRELFHVCSLSARTLVYKGQLTSHQLRQYFPDLRSPAYASNLAMLHSRFSTNTFPSWDRAQPMRFIIHNGEINTLRGNVNWMKARQGIMRSPRFGDDLEALYPITDPATSDSGNFDNVLELLVRAGRSLPEAIMMMIPEAWEKNPAMDAARRAFFEYNACLMEPWDGPASIGFTDGRYVGAVLDRNGLRPSRYWVTRDGHVILASEVGVLDIPPEDVVKKGRVQPGRVFLVDLAEGRIVDDDEIKKKLAAARPYEEWLNRQLIELTDLPAHAPPAPLVPDTLFPLLQSFGYTSEHLYMLMVPMATNGQEAIGSMGNDAALACLSNQPRLLYDYFSQTFAQVTNPPIDPIREELVMGLECYIGPEGNLLDTTETQAHRLKLEHPVLTNENLAKLKHMTHRGWRAKTIDLTYPRTEGAGGLLPALQRLEDEAVKAIEAGFNLIVLSDRAANGERVPVSALLGVGVVHQHLVRHALRSRVGIVLESGEPREVHHFCVLLGYGADAVNPYLAYEAMWQLRRDGVIDPKLSDRELTLNYAKATEKGILKVMSKMGISTLRSYKAAQIFECVGLQRAVVDRCFTGTSSRLEGVGFDILAKEALKRHELGFPSRDEGGNVHVLPNPGEYYWRAGGEHHSVNPESIQVLQLAARTDDEAAYWKFSNLINDGNRNLATLRGLFRLQKLAAPIPLDEVEPATQIVRRFRTGAMSFGSLSKEAHETLAIAMNRIGGKSNSGEGGEDPERYAADDNGDMRRSAIKQVASARFGVTMWYLANADELQIKIAQGAKPGEGGQLPGFKVDEHIARVRHSTPGVGLISPPPHHDIYSIEDLAQLIYDLKNANPAAAVSVKLVAGSGVGTVAAGVAKARADHILISGHDGGTGASPLTSIKHAGMPWELGLAETQQTLVMNDLRSRVRLEVDGQIKTGRDVVIGALLGAEEFGFSTAPLITLGCIMMRKCHLNTCPVGVATQDPVLRRKFQGKPEYVINYLFMVAEEVRVLMSELGVRTFDELVGRVDLIDPRAAIDHWKARGLDLSPILAPALKPYAGAGVRRLTSQDHGLEAALDHELIRLAEPGIIRAEPIRVEHPVRNIHRAVGTMLSHEVARRHGENGLDEDTIRLKLTGSAGQSAAAWLMRGVTVELEGDANDYAGKGLSGGRLIVYPPRASPFAAEENVVIGNVALYGATSGQAFFRGLAGERFAVRNSGAHAVAEGVGDHGCEYMTGGRVVVLGPTGRNFAAGMSGGVAYVHDPTGAFASRVNLETVAVEKVDPVHDGPELRGLVEAHLAATQSAVAQRLLADWGAALRRFAKVMPHDYKRYLASHAPPADAEVMRIRG